MHSLARPFVELFHELRGTVSPFQRMTAQALRETTVPRTEAVAKAVAALHAPWWGFVTWGAAYAMTVMLIAAVLTGGLVESLSKRLGLFARFEWTFFFWVGVALSAPVTFLPFRRWVQKRRRDLTLVARQGVVTRARITKATVVTVHGGLSLKGSAHSTHLTLETEPDPPATYGGYVAAAPAWAVPGHSTSSRCRALATEFCCAPTEACAPSSGPECEHVP
jgi:hypothetical protein